MKIANFPDFQSVQATHHEIHERLENWARYIQDRKTPAYWMQPIWKLGKSNGRQWYTPELRPEVDVLDGGILEKAVNSLPDKHKAAIRWCYVYKDSPARKIRELAVTYQGLMDLIHSGRTMLKNRCSLSK